MIFGSERGRLRKLFVDAWAKHRSGAALEPLERLIADVVAAHPEYQPVAEEPASVEREWRAGEGNPFLHMAMHVAIHEQLASDRPEGVRALYRRLLPGFETPHALEHAIMECLESALQEAMTSGRPPDEEQYLECVRGIRR